MFVREQAHSLMNEHDVRSVYLQAYHHIDKVLNIFNTQEIMIMWDYERYITIVASINHNIGN